MSGAKTQHRSRGITNVIGRGAFLTGMKQYRKELWTVKTAPLPSTFVIPKLRCRVLAPDIFGAGPLDQ